MNPVLIIMGPTASGKTDLSLALAKAHGGEIISADSRQIYQGMNIGTAKSGIRKEIPKSRYEPFPIEGIPHYLIDILEPDQSYSAAEFSTDARRLIQEVAYRGKIPIIVGGTGFYVRVLTGEQRISTVPPDPAFRKWAAQQDTNTLLAELRSHDENAAVRTSKQDRRRVIRALEVARHPAHISRNEDAPLSTLKIGVSMPRPVLRERILRRTNTMFDNGLIQEVTDLVSRYGAEAPGLQTIGYREILPLLDGTITEKDAREHVFHATWQYARRQLTWLAKEPDLQWIASFEEASTLCKKHFPITT